MESLSEILSYEFIRNAIYVGLLASVLCGVIGTFVVVKRLVFLGGGISHAAFGGLGLCYYLGIEPLLGAAGVAILAAVALGGPERQRSGTRDATMGILWAVGMAVGVVFVFKTPGYAPNLMTYLFGNILTVEPRVVWITLAFAIFVLAFVVLFHKEFVAVAFDDEFAAVQGMPVRPFMTLLMVIIALTVVLLIQLVGIILAIALLTIPPIVGLNVVRNFYRAIFLAILICVFMTLGGLAISYAYDLPSGPAIVLLGAALLPLVMLWRRVRSASHPTAPASG